MRATFFIIYMENNQNTSTENEGCFGTLKFLLNLFLLFGIVFIILKWFYELLKPTSKRDKIVIHILITIFSFIFLGIFIYCILICWFPEFIDTK